MNQPERIAVAIEGVMTNLTSVHNEVVQAIAKSDMTPASIIANIENDVYPISNILRPFVISAINFELTKTYAEKSREIVGAK